MLKFREFAEYGVTISQALVLDVVTNPERLVPGHKGRVIAQSTLDEDKVLRVVYEETLEELVIVTFYPGKKARYEKDEV